MLCHDIFGPHSGRHVQICDELAAAGFIALCPDLFGDGEEREAASVFKHWPPKQLRNFCDLLCCCKMGFLKKALKTTWADMEPVIRASMALAKTRYQARFASLSEAPPLLSCGVGFCFGAKPVAEVLTESNANSFAYPFACGLSFHPSLRGSAGELVHGVARPFKLLPAGDDPDDVKAGGALAQVLEQKFGEAGRAELFSEMLHGWMTRGPLDDEAIRRDYDAGMAKMIEYTREHCSSAAQKL